MIDFFNFCFDDTLKTELAKFIYEKVNEKTIIVAIDNFQAIKNFDKIVFVKDGKILE